MYFVLMVIIFATENSHLKEGDPYKALHKEVSKEIPSIFEEVRCANDLSILIDDVINMAKEQEAYLRIVSGHPNLSLNSSSNTENDFSFLSILNICTSISTIQSTEYFLKLINKIFCEVQENWAKKNGFYSCFFGDMSNYIEFVMKLKNDLIGINDTLIQSFDALKINDKDKNANVEDKENLIETNRKLEMFNKNCLLFIRHLIKYLYFVKWNYKKHEFYVRDELKNIDSFSRNNYRNCCRKIYKFLKDKNPVVQKHFELNSNVDHNYDIMKFYSMIVSCKKENDKDVENPIGAIIYYGSLIMEMGCDRDELSEIFSIISCTEDSKVYKLCEACSFDDWRKKIFPELKKKVYVSMERNNKTVDFYFKELRKCNEYAIKAKENLTLLINANISCEMIEELRKKCYKMANRIKKSTRKYFSIYCNNYYECIVDLIFLRDILSESTFYDLNDEQKKSLSHLSKETIKEITKIVKGRYDLDFRKSTTELCFSNPFSPLEELWKETQNNCSALSNKIVEIIEKMKKDAYICEFDDNEAFLKASSAGSCKYNDSKSHKESFEQSLSDE